MVTGVPVRCWWYSSESRRTCCSAEEPSRNSSCSRGAPSRFSRCSSASGSAAGSPRPPGHADRPRTPPELVLEQCAARTASAVPTEPGAPCSTTTVGRVFVEAPAACTHRAICASSDRRPLNGPSACGRWPNELLQHHPGAGRRAAVAAAQLLDHRGGLLLRGALGGVEHPLLVQVRADAPYLQGGQPLEPQLLGPARLSGRRGPAVGGGPVRSGHLRHGRRRAGHRDGRARAERRPYRRPAPDPRRTRRPRQRPSPAAAFRASPC
ncbi:hypothetical protein SMICM304S_00101 [Streptomyces microflavus]